MAQVLAGAGVLRLATLEDGSRWVLPAAQHLAHAAAAWPGVTQVGWGGACVQVLVFSMAVS